MTKTLVYIHDPMCSWCWGFRPAWEQVLQGVLPMVAQNQLAVSYVVGGLAPDSDEPMPEAMQQGLRQTWQNIQMAIPGTEFNFSFWEVGKPRRSTYPACRAVLAAKHLNPDAEAAMIKAIQQAYYLQAKNPSDASTLVALADDIGLDTTKFADCLSSDTIQQALQQNIAYSRGLFQHMTARGFPSLALLSGEGGSDSQTPQTITTIDIDYNSSAHILAQITALLGG